MPYSKESMKAVVTMDEFIWDTIESVSKSKGYKNTRTFINDEIRRIGALHNDVLQCAGKKKKRQNIYRIPRFLEKTYSNLSCRTSLPVSTIVTCYLIIQALEENLPTPDVENQ
jgi:hypothetical protein